MPGSTSATSGAAFRSWRRSATASPSNDGKPGLRPQYRASCYAAFIFDPDGYNVEAVFHGAG
jgi:hypothetical protein